jgi:hypothetical protein
MSTVTICAEAKYGFSGQYIAKIIGRAARVQFNREFCGRKYGKRGESTSYETDEIGLYEAADVSKSGKSHRYLLILPWRDELKKFVSDHEDALALAKRLDDGESLTDIVAVELGDPILDSDGTPKLKDDGTPRHSLVYVIRTKTEAKATIAAATVDSAVDAIVAALTALPEPLQRKALAAAKARLAPPKFAAVGNDGNRPVVWGLGSSETAALADAVSQAAGCNPEVDRTVAITTDQAERILAGEVSTESLGV